MVQRLARVLLGNGVYLGVEYNWYQDIPNNLYISMMLMLEKNK